MVIKKATLEDVDRLLENRIDFVTSIRNISHIEEFRMNTKEYLLRNLEKNTILAYIALEDEKIVSSCILCIYETLPTPSCPVGKTGLLLNVYTLAEYRRMGYAFELLKKLIEEAKKEGVRKIQLDFTDDGYELYMKLGFEELKREMVLRL